MKERYRAIEIIEADLKQTAHLDDLLKALESYKTGSMGDSTPYTQIEKDKLRAQFLHQSNVLVFLLYSESTIAGCSVCFTSFSTFSAGNVLNIHDFCILEEYRSRGLGRILMERIVSKAETLSCSKITLEVREDNQIARSLYEKFCFEDTSPRMLFWTKTL